MRAAFGEVVASCQQYEASLHEHGLVHPRTRELLRAYRSAVQAHREAVVAVAQTLV
jgi:hypothetical protein